MGAQACVVSLDFHGTIPLLDLVHETNPETFTLLLNGPTQGWFMWSFSNFVADMFKAWNTDIHVLNKLNQTSF